MTLTRTATPETDWQAEMFTACAVPGCPVPVASPGDVCTSCRRAFGDMLHVLDGPALVEPDQVAAELRERDDSVRAQYRARATAPAAPRSDSDPKRNQVCWLCEERRTCTSEEAGWECAHCRDTVVA